MAKSVSDYRLTTGLAFVTAAVGAGFAGQAHAALISTAPAGFTPVTLTTGTSDSFAVDLDQNGSVDYTLVAHTNSITENSGANKADVLKISPPNGPTLVNAHATVSRNDVNSYNLKSGNNNVLNLSTTPPTLFSPTTPLDMALVFQGNSGDYLGYIQGTATVDTTASTPVGTFTITDFGYDTAVLPEPSSLALLAAGAAGLAAFRRRRALQAA